MARPIKETPVLHGEAAIKFARAIKNIEKVTDSKEIEIKKSYNRLMAIAQF